MQKLFSKYSLVTLLFLIVFACNEPCLDMPLINETTLELQAWYTNETIETKTANSNIGISDEVTLQHTFNNFGDTIWDDCGNATESERSTVSYHFFNFPFFIETEFYKQGEENGFQFIVNYNTYGAKYKFTSDSSTSNNTIDYITDYELNDALYPEAFRVVFNETQDDTEIKELILVKNLGIIYIVLNDGITINLN